MGQDSSTANGARGAAASAPAKTCYYELLDVSRTATPEEIKKAYRRKALELHPDRNPNDVERATKLFAEVQTAYEVLSDAQERAWYDSHRDAILRGADHASAGEHGPRLDETTAEDVVGWTVMFSVRMSYSDADPNGFYQRVGKAFETLAMEEREAAEMDGVPLDMPLPPFGTSRDTYESGTVRDFYLAWTAFRTVKPFAWADKYYYQDAPDRRVKRLMEKENRRAREAKTREYNDAVAGFVKFVRKRDPRFSPNSMTVAQRQEKLRMESVAQGVRQRKENARMMEGYTEAEWTKVDEDIVDEFAEDETEEEEEEEEEIFECIACKKSFRSQGQMDAHEKSKKHQKAVWQLKKQMIKENKEFDLDRDVFGREKREEVEIDEDEDEAAGEDSEADAAEKIAEALGKTNAHQPAPEGEAKEDQPSAPLREGSAQASEDDRNEDSDYGSAEEFERRVVDSDGLADQLASAEIADSEPAAPKIGKAKAKRAKKAQKAAAAAAQGGGNEANGEFTCGTCKGEFPSKTKLFSHLKENPKHARLVPAQQTGGKGKGKKGKR